MGAKRGYVLEAFGSIYALFFFFLLGLLLGSWVTRMDECMDGLDAWTDTLVLLYS